MNTEIYKAFSVPIEKKLDNGETVTYKIKFTDSFRFMLSSLSYRVKNFCEGLHNDKCTDLSLILNTYQPKRIKINKDSNKIFASIYKTPHTNCLLSIVFSIISVRLIIACLEEYLFLKCFHIKNTFFV